MKNVTLLLSVFVLSVSFADAQLLDPRKIAKRKAEQKTNQKIDQSIDKALDKVFNGFGKKDKPENGNSSENDSVSDNANQTEDVPNVMSGLFGKLGLGNATPPAASYTFASSYTMKVTSQGRKKDDNFTVEMKYLFDTEGKVMGSKMMKADNPDMNKSLQMMEATIFDWEKSQMYNFMNVNGQKQYMGISIKENTLKDALEEENNKTTFTKLGTTKTILGYVCDAYLNDDGESKSTVWISQQAVPSIARYYDAFNRMSASQKNKMSYRANPEMLKMVKEGRAMLGMEMTDNGTQTEMEVVKISPNDNYTFNASGYSSGMDVNAIMKQAEQSEKN